MSARARKRLYRERQRLGLGVVPVETDVRALAEMLEMKGYVRPRDTESLPAVASGASRWLSDILRDASLGNDGGSQ